MTFFAVILICIHSFNYQSRIKFRTICQLAQWCSQVGSRKITQGVDNIQTLPLMFLKRVYSSYPWYWIVDLNLITWPFGTLSLPLSRLCIENKIIDVCLHPNNTHIPQPLDVTFISSVMEYWCNNSQISQWPGCK